MAAAKGKSQKLQLREVHQRQLDDIVRRAMTLVLAMTSGRKPAITSHFFTGASAIHPRYLVMSYVFRTEKDLEVAKINGLASDIEKFIREALIAGGYTSQDAAQTTVTFASDETSAAKRPGTAEHAFNRRQSP